LVEPGSERLDGRRIHDTYCVAAVVQVMRERFTVSSGSFQAGVHLRRLMLFQPRLQLRKASRVVGKNFVLEFAVGSE
jgi:hypothetical protein